MLQSVYWLAMLHESKDVKEGTTLEIVYARLLLKEGTCFSDIRDNN
jgi:hypothetical protein